MILLPCLKADHKDLKKVWKWHSHLIVLYWLCLLRSYAPDLVLGGKQYKSVLLCYVSVKKNHFLRDDEIYVV